MLMPLASVVYNLFLLPALTSSVRACPCACAARGEISSLLAGDQCCVMVAVSSPANCTPFVRLFGAYCAKIEALNVVIHSMRGFCTTSSLHTQYIIHHYCAYCATFCRIIKVIKTPSFNVGRELDGVVPKAQVLKCIFVNGRISFLQVHALRQW